MTQLGFARVSSHSLLGYGMTPEQAFVVLRRFLGDQRHHFVPDDVSAEDRVLRTDLMRRAYDVTDFYLVALARQRRLTVATFDESLVSAFANEPGVAELVSIMH